MRFCELLRGEGLTYATPASADMPVRRLTENSQTAERGALFFCIPGSRCDGHEFAREAYLRGCRHFVAERPLSLPDDATVLYCGDTAEKMAELCARYYGDPCRELTVVGVTGTKGKTTTAVMAYELLAAAGKRAAYIGSLGVYMAGQHFETEHTTPDSLTLWRYMEKIRRAGIDTVILEVSSQALLRKRVHGIPFSFAVFTNLTRDHIGVGEHTSFRGYREAKLSLFRDFPIKTAILNANESFSAEIAEKTGADRILYYGSPARGGIYAGQLRPIDKEGKFFTEFSLFCDGRERRLRLPLAGAHYVEDLLAALTLVGACTGMPISSFLPYVASLEVPGRCRVIPIEGRGTFVLDYAHNGASLAAALRGLRPYVTGRLYCLFGAVGERTKCRRRDMAAAAYRHADFSVISEDNSGNEDAAAILSEIHAAFPDKSKAICIRDRREAIAHLFLMAKPGDVVLLAGKGNERFQRFLEGNIPFSEEEILRQLASGARYEGKKQKN